MVNYDVEKNTQEWEGEGTKHNDVYNLKILWKIAGEIDNPVMMKIMTLP